jgi:hypothetical protein
VETQIPAEMRKVRTYSRVARTACTLVIVGLSALILAMCLGIALGPGNGGGKITLGLYSIRAEQFTTPAIKIWAIAFIAIMCIPILRGALHLRALFANFVVGDIYTEINVQHLRRIALLSLAMPVLIGVLVAATWLLVETGIIDKALVTAERLNFNLLSLPSWFVGPLLLLLASWIMEVGRRTHVEADTMRREAELTI